MSVNLAGYADLHFLRDVSVCMVFGKAEVKNGQTIYTFEI